MEILQNAIKQGSEFTGGHILDPENGKSTVANYG
ncbi:MAG: DUF2147 domain-containing protein [Cyclobacteriaceae bacterium]